MQTNSPLHYNAHQKQITPNKERMTGSSPVSPASSSSPASSAGGSPAHLGSLGNDSLDGPGAFGSPRLQPREALACGPWAPDLGHCNQNVKGQPWDKTHAEIAEQAKHEAKIEHRITELRREGLWSLKRLNRVQEPARPKTHWDYLCEEMQWLSADFAQERRWKRGVARKVARTVLRFHEEQRQKEERAKRDEQAKLRRIASTIAKEVKQFWTNVEKVVQFKQQSRLEEKRKKALDLQLDFIVGQTEKYSDLLSQTLNESQPASKPGSSQLGSSLAGSAASSPPVSSSVTEDEDFEPHEEEDDEETIEVEEKQAGNDAETRRREIELLRRESELPLEEVLRSMPAGLAEQGEEEEAGSGGSSDSSEEPRPSSIRTPQKAHQPKSGQVQQGSRDALEDREFAADEEEGEDEEETIDAEEELEGDVDHKAELDDLAKESELPMEDLLKKYSAAFSDSFETPESDSDDSSDTEEDDDEESDETATEYEEEEESSSSTGSENSTATDDEEEEEEEEDTEEDIGVEYLIQGEPGDGELSRDLAQSDAKGPKKEITDIAAAAESLQPKGYTLATTQVKTPVPLLLRGTLREYQHIGLDWLVTMYEKKLNGILADEMGLGKTIQTIALLAHLAIEKCNWGPHLIIVPTSVMLNWEMEFKRWCPSFKILTYYGVQKERKLKRQGWTKPNAFHVCITSYKLVLQDHQAFRRKNWKYMILDEAQNIKNFKSQRWQSLLNFNSQRRLLLTGTPLQNSLMELWSLMHFLMPHVFQSHREFKEWFSNPLTGMIEGSQEYNENLVKRLHKVLRPFLLRRIKLDVEKQMPKKYEHVVQCRLSKRQRYLYDDFMSQASTRETLETGHFMSVINILMQLRKVCNHPNLFDPRPIHSPLITAGICYTTGSCVLRALEHDPFKQVDLGIFDLINIEGRLSKYESEVFLPKNKVSKKLIEEIAEAPDPPPRPKPVRMKVNRMFQPTQKPDGRTVVLVNSPRPPVPVMPHPSQPQRPPASTIAEMLQTAQTTNSLHSIVNPVTQAVVSSHGLSAPLSLSHVVTSAPRTILTTSRPPLPVGALHHPLPVTTTTTTVRPLPLSTLRVNATALAPGTVGSLLAPAAVQSPPSQQLTAYTVQGASSTNATAVPQHFILSPDMHARLPTGEVVSIGQLASLANRQGGHQASQGSKPVTFQIQGNKLTLAGAQVRQVAVGQPRQMQGNMVHLVSTGGHHIIGQPAQLALIQAMAQQNAQPAVGVQASLQTLAGPQSAISAAATASPGLTVPLTATQVPSSVVTSAGVVKIVVRQAPKEGFPLAVHSPRPLTVSAARFPATVVTPARVQLPVGALTLSSAPLPPAPRPVLRVVHAPTVNAEQAAPTVTRLVVAGPNTAEKEDAELPTLRPVLARAPAPAEPVSSTSLAALRPRRQPATPAKSPFQLEELEHKRRRHRQERLERIFTVNERRCAASPVYGTEVLRLCTIVEQAAVALESPPESDSWRGLGYAHCLAAQVGRGDRRPEAYWRTTRALDRAVHNPEERIEELTDIIDRFIFVIPPVEAPAIQMHVSHPHPSFLHQQTMLADALHREFSPRTARLHRTICNMRTQFPDLRLIQYDCGKLQVLDILLRRLKVGGHRVLLFTQMTRMLDILEQFLNFHGHIYLRLDGSTKVEQRQILMDRFNADKRIFCFILSTRSGGVGVNLTGADTVLFYDSDWNPTMDAQAQDRCHRIGQTRDVHIYRLISDRTVEDNILKKANQKRMLGDLAIEGGNFTTAFFKEQTIRELFDLPTEEPKKDPEPPPLPPHPEEEDSMSAKQTQILEQALGRAEDEEDIRAASQAKAEQVAELAEFNENIPLDGEDGSTREEEEELSKAEQEIAALVEQLTPIERYAMKYLEASLEAVSKEELKQAEEQVEAARKDLDQAKDEVWKWAEEDARGLSEELHVRRQKKARPPPRPQAERPCTRMSERLRGARLGAREAERTPGGPLEAPAKPIDSHLLRYEAPSHDLQIHISAKLPDELFEEEPAAPEEQPAGEPREAEDRRVPPTEPEPAPEPPPVSAEAREPAEGAELRPEEDTRLEGVPLCTDPVANGRRDDAAPTPDERQTEVSAAPTARGLEPTPMAGGECPRTAGALPALGQASEFPTTTVNHLKESPVQQSPDGGGLTPNGFCLDNAESQSSEERAPRTLAALDAGEQSSEERAPRILVALDAGGQSSEERAPRTLVPLDAGGQSSEEHDPRTLVSSDAGGQSSEDCAPRTLVSSDAGGQSSEECAPRTLVALDAGGQSSEECAPRTLVALDAGGQRSEERAPRTLVSSDAGGQSSEVCPPRTLVTADMGSQMSEEEQIPNALGKQPAKGPVNFGAALGPGGVGEPEATGGREMGTFEAVCLSPATELPSVSEAGVPEEAPEERESSRGDGRGKTSPSGSAACAAVRGEDEPTASTEPAPETADRNHQWSPRAAEPPRQDSASPLPLPSPKREAEQKRAASDREAEPRPDSGRREKKRRRTADQDLLCDRVGAGQDCAQMTATVLRKVPGRINVIVERREPTKRARRAVAVAGDGGKAADRETPKSPPPPPPPPPPSPPPPQPLPNDEQGPRRREVPAVESSPSGESGSGSSAEGQQPPVKRPRPAIASRCLDTEAESPAACTRDRTRRWLKQRREVSSSSSSSSSGEERRPAGKPPPSLPFPRSTRQRPGDLVPPLERKRYKPRGCRAVPGHPPPVGAGGEAKRRRGRSSGVETPSAQGSSSSSSSSSSSPSPSPSPSATPDRVLRSLTAAAAIAAASPAANTRSAQGGSPAPLPSAKRKGRPPSSSRCPAPPGPGRGRPPKAKRSPVLPPSPPPAAPGPPRRGRPPNPQPRRGRPPNLPAGVQPRRRGRPPASPPKRRGRPPSAGLGSQRAGRKQQT